jgi:tetratricopeptide (TPR) repeat protein
MDPEEIEKLQEAAVGLYVSGRYAEARRAWEAVLASVPQDERAIEGIRMVRVLSGEWPADAPGSAAHPAGSLEDELRRIEGLLAEARYGDALLAAQRAVEADRGSAAARRLAARALELYEAAPYIDVELTKAKHAASEGRADDAREACQRVLSLDPAHAAAAELYARAAGESPRAARASVPVSPASPAAPAQPAAKAPPAPKPSPPAAAAPRPASPAPSPIQAPPADALFDITEDDIAGETPTFVMPLASPGAAPGAGASAPSPQEDAAFNSGVDEARGTKKKDAISGFTEAEGSAHHSLFEMPDEDVPVIKTNFSELEAEIDETSLPPEGEVDFRDPDGGGATASASAAAAPTAKPPTPVDDDPIDFSFDEEDFALTDSSPASGAQAGGSSLSPEARIAALLDESRRALNAGRYPGAIEAAARAFAIDPDAQGAQQLIDEARTRQDEADRVAEETLYTGRDKLNKGDLAGAEESFRAVLKIHPAHREALDGLDQISRRRNELEIQGGRHDAKPAPPAEKKAERVAAVPDSDWPLSETLRPKAGAKGAFGEAPAAPRLVTPSPVVASRAVRRKSSSGIGRKLFLIGGIVGVLVIIAVGGFFALSLFSGGSRPVEKAVLTPPRRERKASIKVDKAAPKASSSEMPKADPAALAAGVPRTLPEARRLASEGKLEAARVVLADMVREAPDNIAAVDALKGVQARIVERDMVAESMVQIKLSFKQDRYEDALRMLYRLPSDMQQNDEIETYKVNAWYNNGINYLLGGNTVESVHCFDEALTINPHDQQAQRLRAYSKTYSEREKDSAFRAFVDQLAMRPIDAK